MNNPWLKKNPWLSMWLSGANAIFGTARSVAAAQLQRQTRAASAQLVKAATVSKPAPKRRRTARTGKRR